MNNDGFMLEEERQEDIRMEERATRLYENPYNPSAWGRVTETVDEDTQVEPQGNRAAVETCCKKF